MDYPPHLDSVEFVYLCVISSLCVGYIELIDFYLEDENSNTIFDLFVFEIMKVNLITAGTLNNHRGL